MEGRGLAEFKDSILTLIVDKPNGANLLWLIHQFKMEGLTKEYLIKVLEELDSYSHSKNLITLTIGQTYHVIRTPFTKKFLEGGGFVKQFDAETEVIQNEKKAALRGSRIEELQEQNLMLGNENHKLNSQLTKQKIKTHWIPIGISIVGLTFAAIPYIMPPVNDLHDQLKPRIDSIENRLKQLENGLKQKDKPKVIDSLKTK